MGLLHLCPAILPSQALDSLYKASMAAYNQKDFQSFKNHTEQALSIHPSQPSLLYNLSAAYALNQENEKAVRSLERLISWNAGTEYETDSDFELMLEDNKIRTHLKNLQEKFSSIKETSAIYHTIDDTIHAEDIWFQDNKLYVTDVYNGQLVVVDQKNGQKTKIKLAGCGMAITKETDNSFLFVSSSVMPNYKYFDEAKENESKIYKINIKTNTIESIIHIPGESVIGSMASYKGNLYATNSIKPEILIIDIATGKLVKTLPIENGYNLQGITVVDNYAYVADYIRGIARLDLNNEMKLIWMVSPDYLMKGIDGLTALDENSLIAIQNNSTPNRVIRIRHNGENVMDVAILDNAIFNRGEPTNGHLIEGRGFLYVANSPWPFYDKAGKPEIGNWALQELRMIHLQNPLLSK